MRGVQQMLVVLRHGIVRVRSARTVAVERLPAMMRFLMGTKSMSTVVADANFAVMDKDASGLSIV